MVRSVYPLFAVALMAAAPALAAQPIPLPAFKSVELEAGGEVRIVPGPVQRVTLVEGSQEFTTFRMRRDNQLVISTSCNDRCPRNYPLRIQIESPYVPDVAVDAGGRIVASPGFAPQRHVAAAVSAGGIGVGAALPLGVLFIAAVLAVLAFFGRRRQAAAQARAREAAGP